MSDRIIAALIIAASIVVGAGLWGGRYTTSPVQQGGVYVVDRFTADAFFCTPRECRPVHWNPTSQVLEDALSKAYADAQRSKKPTDPYDDFLKGKKSN